jgi:hypothetical protein
MPPAASTARGRFVGLRAYLSAAPGARRARRFRPCQNPPVPQHTITRGPPPEGTIHPGDNYEFAEGGERFVGVVVGVVPVEGTKKSEITVEMDAADYERIRAAHPE